MIIVLKEADFSANNIGSILIPLSLSEWTKNVVNRFSAYNWTEERKQYLERFYRNLEKYGIFQNIEYMAMPVFASNITGAVKNLINDEIEAIVPVDANSHYTVTMGKGIARTSAIEALDSIIKVPQPTAEGREFRLDFHLLSYPLDDVIQASQYDSTSTVGDYHNYSFASYLQTWGYPNGIYTLSCGTTNNPGTNKNLTGGRFFPGSSNAVIADRNIIKQHVTLLGSVYNNTVNISVDSQDYVAGGAEGFFNANNDDTTKSPMYMGLAPIIADGVWSARRFGFLSYGKHLTNEQSKTYQTLLRKLITQLG